jgi:hypothetical protein
MLEHSARLPPAATNEDLRRSVLRGGKRRLPLHYDATETAVDHEPDAGHRDGGSERPNQDLRRRRVEYCGYQAQPNGRK